MNRLGSSSARNTDGGTETESESVHRLAAQAQIHRASSEPVEIGVLLGTAVLLALLLQGMYIVFWGVACVGHPRCIALRVPVCACRSSAG